ncbi:MAG: hypothetical protein GY869_26480, partial [Planctomycetes bacterium]|nr:hypothetical protein [Planctomycetota bacterium]
MMILPDQKSPLMRRAGSDEQSSGGVVAPKFGVVAKLPLGTNANFSPTSVPDSGKKQSYNPRIARAERYRLQKKAQEILWKKGVSEGLKYPANYHKTTKCLRVAVGDKIDIHKSATTGRAFYGGGLVVCGKPGCPVCSAKIQERRRVEIAQCFDWGYSQ